MPSLSSKSPATVWWEYVGGPSLFLRRAVDILRPGCNLCLLLPDDFPWRDYFFEVLRESLREEEPSLTYDEIVVDDSEPGRFLIHHLGLDLQYRASRPAIEFLRDRKALNNRLLHLRVPPQRMRIWCDFARSLRPSHISEGLFIIESQGAPPSGDTRYLQAISLTDFVSSYDSQIFAGLLLPDLSLSSDIKNYIASLAASLFDLDVEKIASFVSNYRFGDNPFAMITSLDAHTIADRIWQAQVRTLFPLIMAETEQIIKRWRDELVIALGKTANFYHGFRGASGDIITLPEELEIGQLRYLMRHRIYDEFGQESNEYILYIPHEPTRMRIELLSTMRNNIAHGDHCPIYQVVTLLQNPLKDLPYNEPNR